MGRLQHLRLDGRCHAMGLVRALPCPRYTLDAKISSRNMFIAAAPYFQRRFRTSPRLLSNFQPAEISISSVINLVTILVLTNLQTNASYPRRIILSLVMNVAGFTLLSISTKAFLDASAGVYFTFLMLVVGIASSAAGFMQNGAFAYAAGMGRPDYIQGIMAGQGIAGILPLLVQIGSVLSTGNAEHDTAGGEELSSSALGYFVTAAVASCIFLSDETTSCGADMARREHRVGRDILRRGPPALA
jgi:equilibrative nucleoside transporter 1/2/3